MKYFKSDTSKIVFATALFWSINILILVYSKVRMNDDVYWRTIDRTNLVLFVLNFVLYVYLLYHAQNIRLNRYFTASLFFLF